MNNKKKWNIVPADVLYDYENDSEGNFVPLKIVVESLPKTSKHSFAYGVDKNGKVVAGNFSKLSHMLIAGEYGCGKEMFIDTLLTTLIMKNSPSDLKIVIINTKRAVPENLKKYSKLPHLCFPITTSTAKRDCAFKSLFDEMNDRYELFEKHGVATIDEFNKNAKANKVSKLPLIITIINDYKKYAESNIVGSYGYLIRLAQKARASGIHLIICTNRSGYHFIGPALRSNMPTKIMFDDDSKMSVKSPDIKRAKPIELTCGFVSTEEIKNVIDYCNKN